MKISLALLVPLIFLGCGKKINEVKDTPPQFELRYHGADGQSQDLNNIGLVREAPSGAPFFEVVAPNQRVKAVDKKLLCGPLTLVGIQRPITDSMALIIRLSDDDIPGLKHLPRIAECELQVTVTNETGSTLFQAKKMKITFDTNPHLDVHQYYVEAGRQNNGGKKEWLTLEVDIHNTLPYQVGFVYTGDRGGDGRFLYDFDNQGNHSLWFSQQRYWLSYSTPQLQGDYVGLENNAGKLTFSIPPDGKITLLQYSAVQEMAREKLIGSVKRTLVDFYLWEIIPPTYNMSIYWSFQRSALDDTPNPVGGQFHKISAQLESDIEHRLSPFPD